MPLKQKILYVYDKAPDNYSRYLIDLLNFLQSKLNLKVLTYGENPNGNYDIRTYSLYDNIYRLFYKLGLVKYKSFDLKIMNQFDIVHLQFSYLRSKIFPLVDQANRPKIVITLRGGDTYLKPWISESWRNFYGEFGENIDAFIVMSEHQKEYLQKWVSNKNRIHVIPISFGEHSNSKPKYPNNKTLYLVSAFRMTWEKNIEGSIQFAKLLKEKGVAFHYDIYGDGSDLGQLYFLVDKYNLSDFVHIRGQIDNILLKDKLIEYDFFIQLSISEALPASVLEAQSIGIPCVISDSGGLPESVIAGKTAIVGHYSKIDYLVDECLKVWQDKELYFSFSTESIKNVNEKFTIEKESKKLIKLYKSLYD